MLILFLLLRLSLCSIYRELFFLLLAAAATVSETHGKAHRNISLSVRDLQYENTLLPIATHFSIKFQPASIHHASEWRGERDTEKWRK